MFDNKLFIVLWERKILFALTGLIVFAGILVSVFNWPKTYSATARLLIDPRPSDAISGMPAQSQMSPNFLTTQVDVIQSSRVAAKAIELMKLESSAVAQDRFKSEANANQTFVQYYAEQMQRGITVKPNRDSNVIDVSYRAGDPVFAAQVANAFARAYINTNLELRVQPAKEFAEWFESRFQAVRSQMKDTQRRHSDLQRKAGITSADERLDVENARLQELSSQLVALQSQLSDSERRSSTAKKSQQVFLGSSSQDQASIPEVMNNPLVQTLKSDLARAEARRAELAEQLGKRHPQMVRMDGEIDQLKAKLGSELNVATGTVDRQLEINRGRESTLRQALSDQKEKVLRIKRDRDELAGLSRELESSQRAHDVVSSRLNQTTLESQSSTPNVVLLDEAVVPTNPISPRTGLGLLMALALAPLVALFSVIIHEAIDKRIRSARDLEEIDGIKVLCIVGDGRASRTKALFRSIQSIFKTTRRPALAR